MKYPASETIGSPATRHHHSFGMASFALPSLLILVLSLSFAAGQVRPQCGSLSGPSTTWSNANGSWGVTGNWTSGTPGASTNACILDGTSRVTVDTNGSSLGLQIGSGNVLNFNPGDSLSLSGASFNYGYIDNEVRNGTITNSGTFFNAGTFFFFQGAVYNSGTLINTATKGLAFFIDNGGLSNTGVLVNYGTAKNEGIIVNASGASLINYGTLNSDVASVITNSGKFLNTSGGTIYLDSMLLNNYGTLSNAGTLTTTFGTQFNNYGTLLNNSGGTLFNDSRSTVTNTGMIINSATINNDGKMNNSGSFMNSGAVTISSSGLFTTSTNYRQTGGSTLVNGTLTATGSAIVDIQRGTLGGTGTINGNVVMAGTIMPGAPGTPGTLTIFGGYEQTGTGILRELMSPLSRSFLNVSGNATLDSGSLLDITLLNGFNPLGQTFSIMGYNALTGQFSNGSSFWDDGFLWDINYGQHEIDVTAVQAPEPSSLLLLVIGLAVLALYAHRKMDKTQRLA